MTTQQLLYDLDTINMMLHRFPQLQNTINEVKKRYRDDNKRDRIIAALQGKLRNLRNELENDVIV